jgi:hypothetical protein
MKLPPGWMEACRKACVEAGTPGTMHELLARSAVTWRGKTTMWMVPGAVVDRRSPEGGAPRGQ